MTKEMQPPTIVRAGGINGLGSIYDQSGRLIPHANESVIGTSSGWDMQVFVTWRRILPKILFPGFRGSVSSTLYITSDRIVLIREIDAWRETRADMTILGIPEGISKAVELRRLAALGAREYCEVGPGQLHISRARRSSKRRSWMALFLVGDDGIKYKIVVWKEAGIEEEIASLMESRFRH